MHSRGDRHTARRRDSIFFAYNDETVFFLLLCRFVIERTLFCVLRALVLESLCQPFASLLSACAPPGPAAPKVNLQRADECESGRGFTAGSRWDNC